MTLFSLFCKALINYSKKIKKTEEFCNQNILVPLCGNACRKRV